MASDNHAHYARIGFTVAIGIAAIAGALIYIGGIRNRYGEFLAETYYDNAVSGLSVGSPVNMRGVKVGEVREISFTCNVYAGRGAGDEDIQRIRIVMAINKLSLGLDDDNDEDDNAEFIAAMLGERVRQGLRATVVSSGITGLSRIEVNIVENPPPCAVLGWTPEYPLIPPSPSLMESFSEAATKLMNRMKTMDFNSLWSNLQVTADSAARIAQSADAMVASQRSRVNEMIRNADSVTVSLKDLVERLKENPSLLLRPNDPEILEETK